MLISTRWNTCQEDVARVSPGQIANSNPGCMIQLAVGYKLHGTGKFKDESEPVRHVVELLDEAYRNA